MKRENLVRMAGLCASTLATLLWLTFIDQIRMNLNGHKGSLLIAITVTVNCIAWVSYGLLKSPRDWNIVWSNIPGILLGIVAVITTIW